MYVAGIRIFCTEERSQGQNRERAMQLLRARLFEMELEKQRAEIAAKRKSQVSSYNSLHLPSYEASTMILLKVSS